jgi:hypothetical protein
MLLILLIYPALKITYFFRQPEVLGTKWIPTLGCCMHGGWASVFFAVRVSDLDYTPLQARNARNQFPDFPMGDRFR